MRQIVAAATRELETTPLVIALGDSAMDAEFVALADVKIAIPRPDGSVDPVLAALPMIRVAPEPGPAGWAAEIHSLIDHE